MSLRPLFFILAAQGIGALAVWLARVPLPDAVIGMLLLFAYLAWNKPAAPDIEPAADTLLRYLPLFFVPASVGVIRRSPPHSSSSPGSSAERLQDCDSHGAAAIGPRED